MPHCPVLGRTQVTPGTSLHIRPPLASYPTASILAAETPIPDGGSAASQDKHTSTRPSVVGQGSLLVYMKWKLDSCPLSFMPYPSLHWASLALQGPRWGEPISL